MDVYLGLDLAASLLGAILDLEKKKKKKKGGGGGGRKKRKKDPLDLFLSSEINPFNRSFLVGKIDCFLSAWLSPLSYFLLAR